MSINLNRRQRIAAAIAAGVVVAGVTVGVVVANVADEPTVREPVATAEPAEQVEPTTPSTPAPTEAATPEPVIPTAAGEIVPADMIDAARAAGASVYVSPNGDGSGLVVDLAAGLPEQVQADITALPSQPSTMQDFSDLSVARGAQHTAMKDAGIKAFHVTRAPYIEGTHVVRLDWMVFALGLDDAASFGSTVAPTREGALAAAAPMLAAFPDVPVIG
jgi:hypothetical protein